MKKLYLAYGSNLNKEQMEMRCPTAKAIGTAEIKDYELLFKGSQSGAYLTIEPKKGGIVPVAVWEVDAACEASLDRYEGFPRFYYKKTMSIPVRYFDGQIGRKKGFVYIMDENRSIGIPTHYYLDVCKSGYQSFGFDTAILENAALRTVRLFTEEFYKRQRTALAN